MTEAEWFASTDPTPLLAFVKGTASDRKLRLFACACCRRISHLFTDKHLSRNAIEFAERFADGQESKNDLHGQAWGKSGQAGHVVHRNAFDAAEISAEYGAGMVAHAVLAVDAKEYKAWQSAWDKAWLQLGHRLSEAAEIADASMPVEWVAAGKSAKSEERKCQTLVLRDIFANPFRLVSVDPTWATPSVVQLANAMYDERDFDRMAELADALEEAGCHDAAILAHCGRQTAEHVRGCWAVDLLLGKK